MFSAGVVLWERVLARSVEQIPDETLRLLIAPGIGPVILSRLREHFGGDDARIVAAGTSELRQVHGIGAQSAETIRRGIGEADCDRQRVLMQEHGVTIILQGDDDYPPLLAAIPDPPNALWVRGEMAAGDSIAIGIVGSRKCSSYGREQAARFAAMLAQCGYCIISGGAIGIDGEAHRAALRVGGRTIAVMGCGLNELYPPQHAELFHQVINHGAVISEFPMATPPKPENFPRRNRIISGLSAGIVVIEAALRSGALITARLAAEQHGREVMALPGRVDSPASAGCLTAIREGWAALVTSPADVLGQLESAGHLIRGALESAAKQQSNLFDQGRSNSSPTFTVAQNAIMDVLKERSTGRGGVVEIDQLATQCGLPMGQVMAELTMLELRGQVRRDHRGVELRRK